MGNRSINLNQSMNLNRPIRVAQVQHLQCPITRTVPEADPVGLGGRLSLTDPPEALILSFEFIRAYHPSVGVLPDHNMT